MIEPPYPVVLASRSPRRVELLRTRVRSFETISADVDEETHTCQDPWATARRLAELKAAAGFARRPEALVIGGDTVVALRTGEGWTQLAKPAGTEDAATMLRALSGREHVVVSGLALRWPGGSFASAETTVVRFRAITDQEAREYASTGEPLDKAGAYAIQGGAAAFVEWTLGSVTNVIGLPLEALTRALDLVR
ncbi:MAG: septum formation protein Maf [Fimbriimonadaceae bacterium]|nr:septum formation protein Maf [Fimbriimonadaceae bacterium]